MSRFRNKQLYTDVFPEFRSGLIGTEYAPIQSQPLPPQPVKQIKERFGEAPPPKKTLMSPLVQPTAKPDVPTGNIPRQPNGQPTAQTVSLKGYVTENKYDTSLHQETPKSQLDIPIKIPLLMSYPQNVQKYKEEAERYGYFVDPLTDVEHLVLYNPSKKKVVFSVRGTDISRTEDIFTDIASAFTDIKKFNRYKKAEEKYKQVKSKFDNMPITLASHSLGGLISSVLAEPEDKIYTYNRPYFSYPIRKNEVAISVKSDPLLSTTLSGQSEKIIKIPRTYYSKAKDYIEVEKAKVNPDYEQKEIKIPEKYKTDLPNVLYQNVLQGAYPGAYLAYSAYEKYIKKPEIYRQQLLTNLQEQAVGAQQRMERVSARILPRSRSTSPRTIQRIQEAIARPLTNIEQNVLNPTILDTTKRAIKQIIRNPKAIGYDILTSPPIQYAALNLAGGYVSNRAIDSHSIENLPLKIRIK
jgi:hypothetical protein